MLRPFSFHILTELHEGSTHNQVHKHQTKQNRLRTQHNIPEYHQILPNQHDYIMLVSLPPVWDSSRTTTVAGRCTSRCSSARPTCVQVARGDDAAAAAVIAAQKDTTINSTRNINIRRERNTTINRTVGGGRAMN